MFRQFSRVNVFLQLIAVIVVALILSLPAFFNPLQTLAIRDSSPLFVLFSSLVSDAPLIKGVLALGILVFLAFFFYAILVSHDMHSKESLLPVLFYFLLAASLPESISLGPALIATIFLIISLFLIIRIYGSDQPYKQVFSASLCVSTAALFYPPALTFIIFIWLSFLTYRIASWREWIISIIGIVLPFLYMISYFYWIGRVSEITLNYTEFFSNAIAGFPKFSLWQVIFLAFSGFVLLLALFRQLMLIQDKLISIRRKTWIFIDFMIVAALSILLAGDNFYGHLAIVAIPGALLLSNSITGKKASMPYELLSALLLIFLVIARLST
jgi:hypothetical protein